MAERFGLWHVSDFALAEALNPTAKMLVARIVVCLESFALWLECSASCRNYEFLRLASSSADQMIQQTSLDMRLMLLLFFAADFLVYWRKRPASQQATVSQLRVPAGWANHICILNSLLATLCVRRSMAVESASVSGVTGTWVWFFNLHRGIQDLNLQNGSRMEPGAKSRHCFAGYLRPTRNSDGKRW